ncbi:MAG TPA: hypothetical protein VK841_05890 [Polyangiaceae bacterium]|nr:hypothetical protein [Polyangiaceae bacterium]
MADEGGARPRSHWDMLSRRMRAGGMGRSTLLLAALAAAILVARSSPADAGSPAPPRSPAVAQARKPPTPRGAAGKNPAPAAAAARSTFGNGAAPVPVAVASSDRGSADGGAVEMKTLDGGARVFKFSELDIEGRLKSPQLVYFLRRVRAEFAAGDLGHRSFLREMSETRKEPSF